MYFCKTQVFGRKRCLKKFKNFNGISINDDINNNSVNRDHNNNDNDNDAEQKEN